MAHVVSCEADSSRRSGSLSTHIDTIYYCSVCVGSSIADMEGLHSCVQDTGTNRPTIFMDGSTVYLICYGCRQISHLHCVHGKIFPADVRAALDERYVCEDCV